MKTIVLFIFALLFIAPLLAQRPKPAPQQQTPRQKKIQEQAHQANRSAKAKKTKKLRPKKEPNTINTKDPGTDAVINSTTGGRNVPTVRPAGKKQSDTTAKPKSGNNTNDLQDPPGTGARK